MRNRLQRQASRSDGTLRRLSLQTYLIILILLVLVPTLGVVTMTLLRAGESYREASTNQLLQTAHLVAHSVKSELRVTSDVIESYAPDQEAAEPDSATGGGCQQEIIFRCIIKYRASAVT